jgi:hypothetical protein
MRIWTRDQGWKCGKCLLIIGVPLGVVLVQGSIRGPEPTDSPLPVYLPTDIRVDMGEWRGSHLSPVQKISSVLKRHPHADSITVTWRVPGVNVSFEFEDIYDRRRGVLESKVVLHDLSGSNAVMRTEDALDTFTNVTDKAIHAAGQKGLWGRPLVNLLTRVGCKRDSRWVQTCQIQSCHHRQDRR